MTKIKLTLFLLFLILALACFLRFFRLGTIPAGLHADAASQGYNAYSILKTGRDKYGEVFPILFRANGSYQPPVYTYLTIIPILFFGNTVFSAHFISAASGVFLTLLTFVFVYLYFDKIRYRATFSLIASFTLGLSPWALFFSRLAVEANLAVSFFVLSILLFSASLKKPAIFAAACFVLGFSTHVYYSERLISIIFLPLFIVTFSRILKHHKRWLAIGICLFIITQIPHLLILKTGALSRRFDQVSYFGTETSNNSSKNNKIFLTTINIGQLFLDNYLTYYSPKNLFFDSDSTLGRSMPGLSVFYAWFLIPFILGLRFVIKHKSQDIVKIIILLLVITPIPAGFTGDTFYPLRVLDFLWTLTIVIALGLYQIYLLINTRLAIVSWIMFFTLYSFISLYISYFTLFKYEKSENYGYAYGKLMDKIGFYKDQNILIDSARDLGIGERIAYFKRYSPNDLQQQLRPQLKSPYYSSAVNTDEIYQIDNIEVRPLSWGSACRRNLIIIGDPLAISEKHIDEHKLKLQFEIKGLNGKIALSGYSTNPEQKCSKESIY